jgi:hypothetical protein
MRASAAARRVVRSRSSSTSRYADIDTVRCAQCDFLRSSADDFDFRCAPAPNPTALLSMACVDDRGHSLPCRTDVSAVESCAQSQQGELHDMHRRGCGGVPTCLATPGMGRPAHPLVAKHHYLHSRREAGAAGPAVRQGHRHLPTLRPRSAGSTRNDSTVLGRPNRFGYLTCATRYDDTHARCSSFKSANFSWLNFAWEEGVQRPVSAAARAVSW